MSKIVEQMFQKIVQLPLSDQEAIASIVLQEIESEQRWDELFTRPNSAEILARMADGALAEARAGRARNLDLNQLEFVSVPGILGSLPGPPRAGSRARQAR